MRKYIILLLLLIACKMNAQTFGIKTNALYLATLTPNLGVELGVSERISLGFMGGYNFMKYSEKTYLDDSGTSVPYKPQTKHFLLKLEGRYWFCKTFEKAFLGLEAIYLDYSIIEVPLINKPKQEHYQGVGYGGGVTFGYHWALGKRWGLEASIGAGVIVFDYDKYKPCAGDCYEHLGKSKSTYIGPTKAALSFMYFFK